MVCAARAGYGYMQLAGSSPGPFSRWRWVPGGRHSRGISGGLGKVGRHLGIGALPGKQRSETVETSLADTSIAWCATVDGFIPCIPISLRNTFSFITRIRRPVCKRPMSYGETPVGHFLHFSTAPCAIFAVMSFLSGSSRMPPTPTTILIFSLHDWRFWSAAL